MHDVGAAVARAQLLHDLAHDLPRCPRVNERRWPSVRKANSSAPRGAEVERLETGRSQKLDAVWIVGYRDGTGHAGTLELVREVEEMDRAVAREVVVVDEEDVHAAAARGS